MGTTRYVHCTKCVQSKPKGITTEQYARLNVSIEPSGLLIACRRHQMPVVLIGPEQLKAWMEVSPPCDLCAKGIPHAPH